MKRALGALALAMVGCTDHRYVCVADLVPDQNTLIALSVTPPRAAGGDVTAHVEFGTDGGYGTSTPDASLAPDDTHVFDLLGLGPLVDATWRVMVDGEDVCDGTTETRNLPTGLVRFAVTTEHPELMSPEPYIMMAFMGLGGLAMIDRTGAIVWYKKPVDVTWVTAYWEGGTVLFNEFDPRHRTDIAMIRRDDAEGTELETVRTVEAHHTFSELPDGTLTFLRRDLRTWRDPSTDTDIPVIGDAVVEQAPDGTETTLFDAWDWLEVRTTPAFYKSFYRDGRDWTHGNAVSYDADHDTYLTSFSNLDTIVEISRTGGPVRWFGIDGTDPYGYAADSRQMNEPHDPRWTGPDTFTVYVTDESTDRSGIVEYHVNEDAHVLEQIWEYGFDRSEPAVKSYYLGQGFRLENGNELIKWAEAGRIAEVTPDGTMVWELRLYSGATFNEISLVPSLYGGAR